MTTLPEQLKQELEELFNKTDLTVKDTLHIVTRVSAQFPDLNESLSDKERLSCAIELYGMYDMRKESPLFDEFCLFDGCQGLIEAFYNSVSEIKNLNVPVNNDTLFDMAIRLMWINY